jgi:hypothetical protein
MAQDNFQHRGHTAFLPLFQKNKHALVPKTNPTLQAN